MSWTIDLDGKTVEAYTDPQGRTWVPTRWLAETLGRHLQVDERTRVVRLLREPPAPVIPTLPAQAAGATVYVSRPVDAPITSRPVDAPITSRPGQRSAQLLAVVIRQFRVATNPRYAVRDTSGDGRADTFCNIFLWDVTRALGAEIPHWVDAAGNPAPPGTGRELSANATVVWLRQHGARHGWRRVSATDALTAANQGRPAIGVWFNAGGGSGHVVVVRPGQVDAALGLPIAQAGARNFDNGFLAQGFSTAAKRDAVEFYVHD